MDIFYLIQLLTNKQSALQNAKGQAFAVGDLNQMNAIDAELLGVQNTLSQLQMLASVTEAAAASSATPAQLLSSAIVASQTQGPSASAVINGYDISAYATDALYEQKIQTIVNALPLVSTAPEIDVYIQSVASGSPVTGAMVIAAATQYAVDVPLLIAIMQNDSQFGTVGIGATTNNPGNVGNTGSATQTYPSWEDGVAAVAQWLSRHRATIGTTDTTATSTPQTTAPQLVGAVATTTPVVTAPTSTTTPDILTAPSTPPATATSTVATTTLDVIVPVATTTPTTTPVTPPPQGSATSTQPDTAVGTTTSSTASTTQAQ